MERELQREAAELYALPAAEFTAARNARAKALKATQPELAGHVAKLAKPTAAAAAVNRLAHDEPSEVRALAQAGRALRAAQEAAVTGKGAADALGAATAEHRAALERVAREARRLKLSQSVLERVIATLRTASLDPELQPLLERGVLAHELESSGFGLDPGLVVAAPKRRPAGKPKPEPKVDAAQRARVREARERLAASKRELTSAKQALGRAERQVAEAEAELEAAQRRAESPSRSRSRSRTDT